MPLRERTFVRIGLAAAAFVLSACPASYTSQPPSAQSSAPAPPSAASFAATAPTKDSRPIAGEAATLLALATNLKREVDKTDKNILSIPVIDKAREIEKLARKMREGSG